VTAAFGGLSRRIMVAGLVGAALTSSAKAQSASNSAPNPPTLRTPGSQFIELRPLVEAPPLKLDRIDGKVVALNELRGKVVLISFWATWCPPCRRELPMLERLTTMFGRRNLEIVAVSVDRKGEPAIAAFLKSVNVTRLRPFLDPEGRVAKHADEDASSSSPFVLYGMPISYIIDRHGYVAGYITGEIDWTSEEALALCKFYMTN
jgi:thiol-disulfide isomerase/thioredoxin